MHTRNIKEIKSMFVLPYRSVIKIAGSDRASFLQGIITNDINLVSNSKFLYALILSPQGKVLYDLFILDRADHYLIDVPSAYIEDIVKKFNMYRLSSDVEISHLHNFNVCLSKSYISNSFSKEPRDSASSYYRGFIKDELINGDIAKLKDYHLERVNLKIPELSIDFFPQEYFALELCMNRLNAINYQKGCYVGQEVTARTTYRGVVRKSIYKITFFHLTEAAEISPGMEISSNEEVIGKTMQPVDINSLALLNKKKADEVIENNLKLRLNSIEAFIN